MIVQELLPEVYYRESRDFAFIGRLIEVVFNYMKTGADCCAATSESEDISATVVDLLANTLGFESKHQYITKDLFYITSSFTDLVRNKGTDYAINTAIRLLLNSQGIVEHTLPEFFTIQDHELIINVPESLDDIILLEDLFEYILPVGMTYRFNKVTITDDKVLSNIYVKSAVEDVQYGLFTDLEGSEINSAKINDQGSIEYSSVPQEGDTDEFGVNSNLGMIYTGIATTENVFEYSESLDATELDAINAAEEENEEET